MAIDIIPGKDDWLFLGTKDSLGAFFDEWPQQYEDNISKWLDVYKYRRDFCLEHGSKYHFFVAPDKSCIYPERLPFEKELSKARLINRLIEASFGEVIYPYAELIQEKQSNTVYYNADFHWNVLGAITAFNALAQRIGVDCKIVIDKNKIKYKKGWGDLCSRLTPPVHSNIIPELPIDSSVSLLWSNELLRAVNVQVFENKNSNLPTALCFCDSYFWCFSKLLASYFSKLVLVRYLSKDSVFFSKLLLDRHFDFVISEVVESGAKKNILDSDLKKETKHNIVGYTMGKIYDGIDSIGIVEKFIGSLDSKYSIYDKLETEALRKGAKKFINLTRNKHVLESDALKNEVAQLKLYKKFCIDGDVGAVVMNCNPFTNGHRYLVEFASKKVKTLFVFLLQENKSFFPFVDRFILAIKGTNDINNVIVVPSGKFIISSATFKDYFDKEVSQDIVVDASFDLDVFGKVIAPALNIKKRFVGKEPFCQITRQYNAQMQDILPQYGVDVFEIDRKANDAGDIISASLVRRLLKEKNYEKIKSITPQSTYDYLLTFEPTARFDLPMGQPAKEINALIAFFAELHKKLLDYNRIDDATALSDYVTRVCDQTECTLFQRSTTNK